MAEFTFKIWRQVTVLDEVTRTYEAETREAALELAEAEANTFDMDCPDDYEETSPIETGSWCVDDGGDEEDA